MCGTGLNLVPFRYRERLYERDELEQELRAAGFDEIRVTRAWVHDTEPGPKDGVVFSCRKSSGRET